MPDLPVNIVSEPPARARVVDSNGIMTREWVQFVRNLYSRTSSKRGNAIDVLSDNADVLNQDIAENSNDIFDTFAALEILAENIRQHAAFVGCRVNFTGRNTNGTVLTSFTNNVNVLDRTSVGVYAGTFTNFLLFGVPVVTLSNASVEHLIAPTANTDVFEVNFLRTSLTTFEVRVYEVTVSGTRLVKTLYDPIQTGDEISIMLLLEFGESGITFDDLLG